MKNKIFCLFFVFSSAVLTNSSPLENNGERSQLARVEILHHQDHDLRIKRSAGESSMPDLIAVRLTIGGQEVTLRLHRTASPQVHEISKDGAKRVIDEGEHTSSVYVDGKKSASMMVQRPENGGDFQLEGHLQYKNRIVRLQPLARRKRSTDAENYVINEAETVNFNGDAVSRNNSQGSNDDTPTVVARKKRGANEPTTNHVVELAFIVDFTDYNQLIADYRFDTNSQQKIKDYLSYIARGMNDIFASVARVDPSISIQVALKNVYFVTDPNNRVHDKAAGAQISGTAYLTALTTWVDSNLQASNIVTHDHYMATTRLDIYRNGDLSVAGVANLREMCEGSKSVSVVEDPITNQVRGNVLKTGSPVTLAFIAAHELGHTLGSDHDGDATGTSSSCAEAAANVMAPGLSTPINETEVDITAPATFSQCSIDAFKEHLATSTCTTPAETSSSASLQFVAFPEETDKLAQCVNATGFETESLCTIERLVDESDDCNGKMYCRTSYVTTEKGTSQGCGTVTANDGTSCGTGKICYQFRCLNEADVLATTSTQETTTTTAEPTTTTTEETTTTTEATTTTTTEETTTTSEPTTTTTEETTTTNEETTTTNEETTTTNEETTTTTEETTTTNEETTTATEETTTTTTEPTTTTTTTEPTTTTTTEETTTTTEPTTTTSEPTTTTTEETTTTTEEASTTAGDSGQCSNTELRNCFYACFWNRTSTPACWQCFRDRLNRSFLRFFRRICRPRRRS